jgi:sulfate adenylyltransferase subunit 2
MVDYSHLDKLESEAIHIIRESFSVAKNPVMMYSLGKDSSVLLHLAKKAFAPTRVPFPLLHIDTGWKFKDMYKFKNELIESDVANLITYKNDKQTNPFEDGSDYHTKIMKTDALKRVLKEEQYDFVICGARRDEDSSRAKERIYSFRNRFQRWDYKNQRPEPWSYLNENIKKGESFRVFPLSNWTEADIWHYILREKIDVVPLYISKVRPVVNINGTLILCDDDRILNHIDEKDIQYKSVRFRTLGCYPLTGAIESKATELETVISETLASTLSERKDRLIDSDESGMEDKKVDGYF